MPPRSQSGTLDAISVKIGELVAYTHEHRHGVNNLSTKFDALALDIAKRVEAMETKLSVRLDAMDRRIAALEATDHEEKGARNVVVWVLQSPLIGWIAAGILAFVALWTRPPS